MELLGECYEIRVGKKEKDIYLPKNKPMLIKVPKAKYFCIQGKGNPNQQDFQNRIGALYALSYTIRMMPKNGYTPEGYYEYTVYPLEGFWDLSEVGRQKEELDKNELIYTIMIKQPDFVDEKLFEQALTIAKQKKQNPLLDEVYFDRIDEGLCVQMMHIGSYDHEKETFDCMKEYIANNHLEIKTLVHKEIYISDIRKVSPEKLKTVLRYQVVQQ